MRVASAGLVIAFAALQLAPLPGTITVTVIKSRTVVQQPLSDARLELTGPSGSTITRTDASGTFVFSNLPDGAYRLAVTCDGFVRQEFPKKVVLGHGQQAVTVSFALDPAPTATGWILDTYGDPIANVMVEALRRSYDVRGNPRMTRTATGLTDDRGEYRIFWLDPGEYFFYVATPLPDGSETQPAHAVTPTYFPGVNTPEDAKPVRLEIAREARVDFRIRSAGLWWVHGQAMNGMTSRSMAASITLAAPAEDPSLSKYHAQSSPAGLTAGEFSLDDVPPGSYIVSAKSGSGDQEVSAFQRIEIRPVLIPPQQGYGMYLRLSPPLSINGRLFLESREALDLRDASVALISVDPDLPSPRNAVARPDGQFLLKGVVAGDYVLELSNLPQDFYLKAVRFADKDILEKPLALFDDGDEVIVRAGSEGVRFLLVAGKPLREPVAWRGPIVMNTQAELRQAFKELELGTFLKPD